VYDGMSGESKADEVMIDMIMMELEESKVGTG
jgi:hypothetical protein